MSFRLVYEEQSSSPLLVRHGSERSTEWARKAPQTKMGVQTACSNLVQKCENSQA